MDAYKSCRTCKKRCCLNCTNFRGALQFLPGQLVNITCRAQPEEKQSHILGNLTDDDCSFHTYDEDSNVITKTIEGAV